MCPSSLFLPSVTKCNIIILQYLYFDKLLLLMVSILNTGSVKSAQQIIEFNNIMKC